MKRKKQKAEVRSAHEAPAPFNMSARPGLLYAVSAAYARYCESPEAPKENGPNEERAAKHREIEDRLRPFFLSYEEAAAGSENLQAAFAVSIKTQVVRRILEENRRLLSGDLLEGFGRGIFCAFTRTLTGDNGVVLHWRYRRDPASPESCENQQTRVGVVVVLADSEKPLFSRSSQ